MRKAILMSCLLLFGNVVVVADEPPAADKFDVSQVMAMMASQAGDKESKDESPWPDFKKVIEGMKSDEGMFTLWSYPPGAKQKDDQKLLCQIPAGMLGQKFMLSTSYSGGGFFTGFPLDERVVQWEVLDRQLLLIEPETRFVVNNSKEVADVVQRTYPDRIRVAVPIVTMAGADPVIDLGNLLKSNFADIGWMSFTPMFGMGGGGGINASLSKWTKKKVFPGNLEIGVELAVGSGNPPGSYDRKLLHYSFWKLPKTDYKPRIADDRVGYFLTTNQDWAKPTDSRDLFNRYIDRWQLEKRDPSLEKCEPKQPIIFYIEKTVPVRFRAAVRDGILEWNKAFEKIGFLHAIEVRQQTDDNEWKDLDPEDMRYSFFRWIVTGAGFAMGPHRANPFTGQIYDADIIFDDSMVRFFEEESQQMLPSTAMTMKMRDPALKAFVDQFPQLKRPEQTWDVMDLTGDHHADEMYDALREHLASRGYHWCDYMTGMKHQMSVSRAVLAGQPEEVIDRFLYDAIKEVVTHEVGHTLGLRHNFKASTVYSLDEIQQRRMTDQATCGSVMDYNPVLFFSKDTTLGHFVTPTIGPYDYWAIEYGYRPFDQHYKSHKKATEETEEKASEEESSDETAPAEETAEIPEDILKQIPKEILEQMTPEVKKMLAAAHSSGGMSAMAKPHNGGGFKAPVSGEAGMLADIASRSTEPELVYATDEDTTMVSPDPRSNRFDMGSDPIEWADERMKVVDGRLDTILDWAVKDQESWYYLRNTFARLMSDKLIVLDYVGRYIGGQYFNRAHRGEENAEAPFVLVEPALQRRAVDFIVDHLYQDKFFEFKPELLNHLAPSRWSHTGTRVSYTMDYPIRSMISFYQWWNLFDRLFPPVLRRIHDAELKSSDQNKFTLAEYLQRLEKACWHDATDVTRLEQGTWSDTTPFVSDVRRSLQREYLSVIEPIVRWAPGVMVSPDIHAMLKHSLKMLSSDLDKVIQAGGADFASEAHLEACKTRIDRMLNPKLEEYGG